MKSKLSISDFIVARLCADERISNSVGNKVFRISAPQQTSGAYITCRRTNCKTERNKMTGTTQQCKVAVAVISENYDTSLEIAEYVLDCIENRYDYQNESLSVYSAECEDAEETEKDGIYTQSLLFTIK